LLVSGSGEMISNSSSPTISFDEANIGYQAATAISIIDLPVGTTRYETSQIIPNGCVR